MESEWRGMIIEGVKNLQSARLAQDAGPILVRLFTWTTPLHDAAFLESWDHGLKDAVANFETLSGERVQQCEEALQGLLERQGLLIQPDILNPYKQAADRVRAYLANHVLGDGSMPRPEVFRG